MAYADSIRVKTATFNDIADKIEGLLLDNGQYSSTTPINTTSTTMTDMTSTTVTLSGLTTTQKILMLFSCSASISSTNFNGQFQFVLNGSSVGIKGEYVSHRGNTSGVDAQICMAWVATAASGSNTVKIQWCTPSGGTIYSDKRELQIVALEGA